MKITRAVAVTLVWIGMLAAPLVLASGEEWPPLPDETAGMLLVTGADKGYLEPLPCLRDIGGALYRPGFNNWLAAQAPGLEWAWASTGHVLSEPDPDYAAAEPERMLAQLAETGYEFVGASTVDADVIGFSGITEWSRRGVPFYSSNMTVFETGKPALPGHHVVEVGGARLGLVSVTAQDPGWVGIGPQGGTVLVEDARSPVSRALDEAREAADTTVLLANGLSHTQLRALLRKIDPPDLVVAQSASFFVERPRPIEDVPVLWIGTWGQVLGRISVSAGGEILEVRGMQVGDRFPIDPLTGRPSGLPEERVSSVD
jgi:hypothetical protein